MRKQGVSRGSQPAGQLGFDFVRAPSRCETAASVVPVSEAVRLERNLVISAGAGAGKTYSLVTLCLHALSGARTQTEAQSCERLGLLTFTDKAAAEMRSRLRDRLDGLANGHGLEPELRASFDALGRAFPPEGFWRHLRDELGAACIGTFHTLCIQLLRRAPASAGVDPNFRLLDERGAAAILEGVVERVVLEGLQAGSGALRDLVRTFGFGGAQGRGLVKALALLASRIREEGLVPQLVHVACSGELRRSFDEKLRELRAAAHSGLLETRATKDAVLLEALVALFDGAGFEEWPRVAERAGELMRRKQLASFQTLKMYFGSGEKSLDLLFGACAMAPHEAALRGLLVEVARRHRLELKRRGVVDFSGLLIQARDLLRDCLPARREAQARFGALLVDEFQDTNRLQLELVLLLAERREGGPRPISLAPEEAGQAIVDLPLEDGFLAVVGDRKQSIYEFRGADVSVFEVMTEAIERSGGQRAYLQHSRRSSPVLLEALNAIMPGLLGREATGTAPEDFEVSYTPETDDLFPTRAAAVEEAPVMQLTLERCDEVLSAEAFREIDADATARAVAQLVNSKSSAVVEKEALRRLRGGDVALLFQRFTQLEVYRRALVRHGVRHRVVRGRGFYGAQEVLDVASLLSLIAEPTNALACAAVLRSPWVGLSDSALVALARPAAFGGRSGLRPREILFGDVQLEGLSELEAQRLRRFRAVFGALWAHRFQLGLSALLHAVLEGLDWKLVMAAGPYGEQALANVDQLLALAAAREGQGLGVGEFASELAELVEAEPQQAQGEVLDALDDQAVTLCTVHQAKGLEWPVVVLPDLAGRPRSEEGLLRFDRRMGMALRPSSDEEPALKSRSFHLISELSKRRAQAENLRLLYVALTRARDRLIFGLVPGKPRKGSWAALLQAAPWGRFAPSPIAAASLPAGSVSEDALAPDDVAASQVAKIVARVRSAPTLPVATALLPVTHLGEFAVCPRRFHFIRQVGLAQGPLSRFDSSPRPAQGAQEDDDGGDDVRARGTAAHRLLELTPLVSVGTDGLRGTLEGIAQTEGLAGASDEVVDWVCRFWSTRFGRRLKILGEGAVHRELPFLVTYEDADGFRLALKGQIDLLVADGKQVLVVDYKTSERSADGLGPYAFQLECYLGAAHKLVGEEADFKAGVVFLREDPPEPQWFEAATQRRSFEKALLTYARALVGAQASAIWEGRDRSFCRGIGCGFLLRCHGVDGSKGGR